ncbi:histidine--tRNA ligase [Candidatus Roizmanbacteria bacterium CG_4_9_14_3_um_filter_33_18]|uniref:Histidine--tRNA ligase n=3 Tax=Candidatus Roizmaniibacteriota TaxID=1752723 RepID=A0A2M7U8X1_9BACT|nr:MAG: histidine--tRNA ligase [Candidatus Roizmanbacteria bacterium CG22_combo_CG10-13_8_21_14_all_34_12]PIZ67673.1 MAG: histidine--tRNA ligase [Candidatus Roizmanbacteria bacterium CG_4_10_14_0_2_um_filter_33_96]PJA56069.1 MAG: histidine--tRNA ligase [Candidatus Roizmanbacteria bacterium CG_4_9_14_3_um_filter_33_18]
MADQIKVQKLAGFRDYFVEDVKIREYVINIFKKVFEKYGYEPLETPALENSNIFVGELGDEAEKLFYRFKDQGGRDIMLKYDVMTPMCRTVAENINNIIFPYKRYQIQNVWRSEKPQKGRFREFTQCDADTIGSSSVICDAEFIQMGIEALTNIGFKEFRANINSRKLLSGIIQFAGASEKEFIPICISIDKLPKIGREKVKKELIEKRKISPEVSDKILDLITLTGETEELLTKLKKQLTNIPIAMEAIDELEIIFDYFKTVKLDKKFYLFTPFIARGLAYYTGPVWEFEILEGEVGSVAGCGRYDNIIGKFVGKEVAATGGSFGIERLVEVIKSRKMINISSTIGKVLVTIFDKELFDNSLIVADELRKNNISTILYPVPTDKLDKQLKYANKKNIPYVIIIGPEEVVNGKVVLKDMKTGEQQKLTQQDLIKFLISN